MSATFWIIIGGAIVTYLTRIGGHLILTRFDHIHPRVQAGLDAVPAAVLTTWSLRLLSMAGQVNGLLLPLLLLWACACLP